MYMVIRYPENYKLSNSTYWGPFINLKLAEKWIETEKSLGLDKGCYDGKTDLQHVYEIVQLIGP